MNRSKLYLTLLLAFILAGSASLLVSQKLSQSDQKNQKARVVVASKNLEVGTALSADTLKVVSWTGSDAPKGAFSNVSDAVGRAVLYPMFENEPILDAKLAPVGSGAGLPAVIPPGMRAVSIRVDEVVAVAGFVGPGTRVDVMLTGVSHNESQTKTILQNVQVLAAGQKIQPDAQGRAEKVNVVTLLCSSEDAAKVTLGASDGHIQLLLRNPMDGEKTEKTASVLKGSLFGDAPPAPKRQVVIVHKVEKAAPAPQPVAVVVPPPPAPVIPTVLVIRGDRVSTVQVLNPIKANEN
ncbi:MAG: Flp pilus assembly protein CpaB [Bryobacteraceae bacterium]